MVRRLFHNVYDQNHDGDSERLSVLSANGTVSINAKEEINKTLEADGSLYENREKAVSTDVSDRLKGNNASDKLSVDNSKLLSIDALHINSKIYTLNDDPSAKYLVETNKKFADYHEFLSSDYLLERVKADPEKTAKRLGDGYFEQQLVLQQIMQLTGRRYLSSYGSDMEQFAALMNAGVIAAEEMNLTVGIALTAEQVASLTSDMVWLEEQEISGQKVLVPTVYLASLKEEDLKPTGALIVGGEVELYAKNNLENIGTIKADGTVELKAENIVNRFGNIAGENVQAVAVNEINNAGGSILVEKDVELNAKNITNEVVRENGDYKELKQERIIGTGVISAGNDVKLNAAENIANIGSVIAADNNLRIKAGNNVELQTVASEKHVAVVSRGATAEIHSVKNQQAVLSGKNIEVHAGANVNSTGSVFSARENTNLAADGDVNLQAAKDLYNEETTIGRRGSSFFDRGKTVDETVVGTELASGKNIDVTAQNIAIKGSNVSSESGAINLNATNDVNISNENEYHESLRELHEKGHGILNTKTTDLYDYSNVNAVVGSNVSGNTVNITTGNDVKVQGSSVAADGDVSIKTGGELDITSAAQTSESEYMKQVKKSGLMAGPGIGFTIGKEKKRDEYNNQNVEQVGSTVGSVNGNVTLQAEKDVNIKGSDVIAGKDIDFAGTNVNIENSDSIFNVQEKHEYERSGLSVSVGGTVANTAQTVYSSLERAHQVEDKRLAALYGVKGYYDTKDGISDIESSFAKSKGKIVEKEVEPEQTKKNGKNDLVNIHVGIGSEKSKRESDSMTVVATESNVKATQNVNITSTKEDINIKGSNVEGENIKLNAAKDLNITASKNSNVTKENKKSAGASVGASIGLAGFAGVDANYSQGKSDVRANNEQYNESNITANKELDFASGSDTNIKGGVLSSEKVTGQIGGNLNVESLQDKNNYKEKSSSVGASISYGTSGLGGSASVSKGNIDSEYESVTTQSGIYAGKEGFDIYVENNTDLKGGIIGSEADAEKNKISTGTITFSDVENKDEYELKNNGFGVKFANRLNRKDEGLTPIPGIPISNENISTSKATVSSAEIEIRNKDKQLQDITRLNRDTQSALNKLAEIFNKTKVQEHSEFARLFQEIAHKEIGNMTGKIDSDQKAVLNIFVDGLTSYLSNGNFAAGASGTTLLEYAQDIIVKIEDPGTQKLVALIIGAAAGEMAGSAQAGAASAVSTETHNHLEHDEYEEFKKEENESHNGNAAKARLAEAEKLSKENEEKWFAEHEMDSPACYDENNQPVYIPVLVGRNTSGERVYHYPGPGKRKFTVAHDIGIPQYMLNTINSYDYSKLSPGEIYGTSTSISVKAGTIELSVSITNTGERYEEIRILGGVDKNLLSKIKFEDYSLNYTDGKSRIYDSKGNIIKSPDQIRETLTGTALVVSGTLMGAIKGFSINSSGNRVVSEYVTSVGTSPIAGSVGLSIGAYLGGE